MNYAPFPQQMIEMDALLPSLQLSPAERLARVLADLRIGLPCLMSDGDNREIVVSVESVSRDRLQALSALFGHPVLLVTGRRASVVMPGQILAGRAVVRIRPPQDADLSWYQRVADCGCDRRAAPIEPLDMDGAVDDRLGKSAIQLVKLANLLPAAVTFTVPHSMSVSTVSGISAVSVTDVVSYAFQPPDMEPVAKAGLPIEAHDAGALTVFRDQDGFTEHYAYEIGTPDPNAPVLVRLHSACFTGDVLGSLKCDCGPQLQAALRQMGQQGSGLLLYLNQEGRGIGLANKMRVYELQAQGFDTVEANHRLGFEDDERDFRIGAAMLKTLGFGAVRLLTNNPKKVSDLGAKGVDVVERVPLRVGANPHNAAYLAVKAEKSGHVL